MHWGNFERGCESRKYMNMGKYKVGDKFVIEIEGIYENVLSNAFEVDISKQLYKIKGFDSLVFDKNGLDKLENAKNSLPIPYSEAYKKGMNEAWEIARELCNTGYNDCTNIFGDESVEYVIKNLTPLEIKEKIESFKKEIKVGDVVTVGGGDITFICTKDNSNGDYTKCHLVAGDGSVYEDCDKFECQKTGKSIDIGEILKEIDT